MKVLLYSEMLDKIGKSGLGLAIYHQKKALEKAGVECTFDPSDSFDILHINTYFQKSQFIVRECRRKGIPIVYHAHSTMEDFKNSFRGSNFFAPLFKNWLMACYKTGDALITPTEYSKSLLQSYGLTAPIYAISNGIDLPSFRKIPNARENFCRCYGFSEDDFIVMGIGLFIERKGILDFLELARKQPSMKFIWFGETNLNIIPHHIKKAIQNPPTNVTFAGYIPNEQVKAAFQACDVFLMTTFEETEGIPALEACACRTPMIVRDIPVFNPWLENKKHTYKAKSIDEFEQLLCGMRQGILPSLTNEAYKVAEARDLTVIGKQLKQVYESVLATVPLRQAKRHFFASKN